MADDSKFNVFLSWAGDAAREVAEAFAHGLTWSMSEAKPWISTRDIPPGDVWFKAIRDQLALKAAIVFLTPQNTDSTWLNFEAGALLGAITKQTHLYPVLLGFGEAALDTRHPLSNLQTLHDKGSDFEKLFMSLAAHLGDARPQVAQKIAFTKMWADLGPVVERVRSQKPQTAPPKFDPQDALEEIRDSLRELKVRQARRRVVHKSTLAPGYKTLVRTLQPPPMSTDVTGALGDFVRRANIHVPMERTVDQVIDETIAPPDDEGPDDGQL